MHAAIGWKIIFHQITKQGAELMLSQCLPIRSNRRPKQRLVNIPCTVIDIIMTQEETKIEILQENMK